MKNSENNRIKLLGRIILSSITVLSIAGLSGCINEKTGSCPAVGNFTLWFSYVDNSGNEVFPDNIETVDLYLFDSEMCFLEWHRLEKSQLDIMQGIKLSLEPGVYNVVCWGNADGLNSTSGISRGSRMEDSHLLFVPSLLSTPLFYAPAQNLSSGSSGDYGLFSMTVPGGYGNFEETVYFMPASRVVNVSVGGFTDFADGNNLPPTIEVSCLPRGYDFRMTPDGSETTYSIQSRYYDGYTEASASFQTPFFTVTDGIEIKLYRQSDGSLAYTLDLKEFLESRGSTTGYTTPISVFIEFLEPF